MSLYIKKPGVTNSLKIFGVNRARILFSISIVVFIFGNLACTSPHEIEDTILNDKSNYFYIDFSQYPEDRATLPIGVFDSGTGGLAVLNDIVEYNDYDDQDEIRIFEKEYFVYLADMANMPYGSYAMENNTELLQEHIIKNVQFLLDNKYYQAAGSMKYMKNKRPVKAIVIACNTATAYGQEIISNFLEKADLDIILIGVIDAASTGVVNSFLINESGSIAVLATDGTVRSGAYVTSIEEKINELGRQGAIQIYQQAGIGIAEAIDENIDFIDKSANITRDSYMGPSDKSENDLYIDPSIIDRYHFQKNNGALLFEGTINEPNNLQINSVVNYVAYHLVSLLEKIRKTEGALPLKAIVLGCTHYPYVEDTFIGILDTLRDYMEDGEYIYRQYMAENIVIVNPAVKVASQLHDLLAEQEILGDNHFYDSEFYISLPNVLNNNLDLRDDGAFRYDYKYERIAGNIQEYVKRIPFNRDALSDDILLRLNGQVPAVYDMIVNFNYNNPKTEYLPDDMRINYLTTYQINNRKERTY